MPGWSAAGSSVLVTRARLPSHAAPRASPRRSETSPAVNLSPLPAACACSAPAAGPRPVGGKEEALFHQGKHNGHKLAEEAQAGLRDAFKLFFRELKEALLPNKQAHN